MNIALPERYLNNDGGRRGVSDVSVWQRPTAIDQHVRALMGSRIPELSLDLGAEDWAHLCIVEIKPGCRAQSTEREDTQAARK